MKANRCFVVIIGVLAIALAISLFYNLSHCLAYHKDKANLISQNLSLKYEIERLRRIVRQEVGPSPASAADIKIGREVLVIPQELHNRRIQIVPHDRQLADSGWVVIDLPFSLISQVPDLDIMLFYRDQRDQKDFEQVITPPIQSTKTCFNSEKQRLEIPVPRHLSGLCRLRFIHDSGISWDFSIEGGSRLVFEGP